MSVSTFLVLLSPSANRLVTGYLSEVPGTLFGPPGQRLFGRAYDLPQKAFVYEESQCSYADEYSTDKAAIL
ncbi:hypothetical protein CCMSSC00406_0005270 [Pleurotus cornucopiae]|uniref:Uncharacterized protein n=1 Tax=Pleurotus cornucopiae TaxID=5321 RepID=A0ACB7IIX8_PLECO|nr:hypothetical protein CCMSSC00406_0005270 [Pleurotus cornucopiae]